METTDLVRALTAALGLLPGLTLACGPTPLPGGDDGDSGDARGATAIDASRPPEEACAALHAVVRDFHRTHPDFEAYTANAVYPGLVQAQLGPDRKPRYAPSGATPHTSGPAGFADWYHDVAGVNQPIPVVLELQARSDGVFAYDSDAFFPIDGVAFGGEGFTHNFHFTTEIHTSFEYSGGESFTFRGDDDLWLFINGSLAIDLGGLHQQAVQTVDLDARAAELGIEVGVAYPMDIFHAERHTVDSTFHIETTIDCFIVP